MVMVNDRESHGETLFQSAPPLETGARHVKVGRGGYSRTDVASCASVVRGPRRTIEVEEGTSSSPGLADSFGPTLSLPRVSSFSSSLSLSLSLSLPFFLSSSPPPPPLPPPPPPLLLFPPPFCRRTGNSIIARPSKRIPRKGIVS